MTNLMINEYWSMIRKMCNEKRRQKEDLSKKDNADNDTESVSYRKEEMTTFILILLTFDVI